METPDQAKTLLRAHFVAPIDKPPVADGAVVFRRDRILAVGRFAAVRKIHPDACIKDIGPSVILPGLINAHTHLELTHRLPSGCRTEFVPWLQDLALQGREEATDVERIVTAAVVAGVRQC